jgi:tetratricopeptide (TPR) repeat protein
MNFLSLGCNSYTDHWKVAQQEYAKKDFLGAIIELNQYLMEDNQDHYCDGLILRAKCYNKIGKHKKAELDLERVFKIEPENESGRLEYVRLKLYLGDTTSAVRLLSTFQSGSGRIVSDAWIEKGKLHFKKARYSQSLTDFNLAIQTDSSNEYAWYYKGALLSSFVSDPDSANPVSYPYLNFEEAIVAFLKTIQLSPEFSDAWYKLGLVYLNQFKEEKGLNCLNMAIKLDSLNPSYYSARAEYYMNKGDTNSALNDYKKLLKIDSSNEEAIALLNQAKASKPD